MKKIKNKIRRIEKNAGKYIDEVVKKYKKIISLILVIATIFSCINFSFIVSAENIEINNVEINDESTLDNIGLLDEIKDRRTKNSKTFLRNDGIEEVFFYGNNIHYLKNGILEEINNWIIDGNIRENIFNIDFPNILTNDSSILLSHNAIEKFPIKISYENGETSVRNVTNYSKISSKCVYSNIYDGIDVSYEMTGDIIKENIILKEYDDRYKDKFSISMIIETELEISEKNGKLYFYEIDSKNGKYEVLYVFNEYVMIDSLGVSSSDIELDICRNENEYKIKITPNAEYLQNATYPVTIDPEINLSNTIVMDSMFTMSLVDNTTNTVNQTSSGIVTIGYLNNASTSIDGYLKLSLDSIYAQYIRNNVLEYAYLSLPYTFAATTGKSKLEDVVYASSEFPYSCDTVFILKNARVQDFTSENSIQIFDILDSFNRAKYDDYNNDSLELIFKISSYYTGEVIRYSLGDGGMELPEPLLKFGYFVSNGISENYTYEKIDINDKLKLNVEHFSGNLVVKYNDFKNGKIDISHYYNSNKRDIDSVYGKGFSLCYDESISQINTSTYKYTKASGEEVIYIKRNNKFVSLNGDSSTFEILDNGYAICTEVYKFFDLQGKLCKIYDYREDYEENKTPIITITFNDNRISNITDDIGNQVVYSYSDGKLVLLHCRKRTDENINNCFVDNINYYYNNNKLIKIEKEEELNISTNTLTNYCVNFSYADNNLESVNTGDAFYKSIEYYSNGRVKKITNCSNKYTNGNYLEFTYDEN